MKLWNAFTEDKVLKDRFDDITVPARDSQKAVSISVRSGGPSSGDR
jgi:hypothetical protein